MKKNNGSTIMLLISGLVLLLGLGVYGYKYHIQQELIIQQEIEMNILVSMIAADADLFPQDGDHMGHMERMSYILDQYKRVCNYKRELCRRYPQYGPYFMDLDELWRMLDRFKQEEGV